VMTTATAAVNMTAKDVTIAEADAEFIAAKAIRDGVVDATIDHEGKFMRSRETTDIYATTEPQEAFHKRVVFCLNLHNEAVKAMRFPPDAYKKIAETEEELKERKKQFEKELEEEAEEEF